MRDNAQAISSDDLLKAYVMGIFPMAESASSSEIYWIDPDLRGILPLNGFHTSKSLLRQIKNTEYSVEINKDFAGVLQNCAAREETWINDEIFALYLDLHQKGFAHSLEIWDESGLWGGVYGVAIGGAFFGESMFSTRPNGSKIALHHLVNHLNDRGFTLFDTQFITDHLSSLGAIEITRDAYQERLAKALKIAAKFN